jgi:hypothetical protein
MAVRTGTKRRVIGGGELPSGPIAYDMVTLQDYPTTYPGDEGYVYLNQATLIDYTFPVDGVVARLDPYDDQFLLTLNEFGTKYRYTSITGGYWDPSDGNYYTVGGVLSTRDAEFKTLGDYYVIDHYRNLGIRARRTGTAPYVDQVNTVLSSSYCGFTDWHAATFQEMLAIGQIQNNDIYSGMVRPPFDIQLTQNASTPALGAVGAAHFQLGIPAYMSWSARADTFGSIIIPIRTHYKN